MSPSPNGRSRLGLFSSPPAETGATAPPDDLVLQRWCDLREMLIRQLEMFEGGGLTLRSNNVDVSSFAIADLRTSILEFDALISKSARRSDRPAV